MQVHVGWLEGGTAILAFRGTQTAQDGLQDVKIVRQSIDHLQGMFPGTQAHSGKIHTLSLGIAGEGFGRGAIFVWTATFDAPAVCHTAHNLQHGQLFGSCGHIRFGHCCHD